MLFSTIAQPQLFLWMALGGMLAALWYALMEGARKLMQAGAVLSLCCDLVFSLGLAAILAVFFLWGNYGAFRLYGLLGAFLGALLCHFALIRPLKKLLGSSLGRLGRFVSRQAKKRPFNIIFK